jgi:uncharacterized membrane protein YjjP (DUF1212 family)
MEYSKLLDLASDLGYELAMSGAETFRVEESISRILQAYDIDAEVFVIPNCMHISIEPVIGRPLTRMRRIGVHGNDLDAVEKFSSLSRRICAQRPAPEIAAKWLEETRQQRRSYGFAMYMIGHFLGSFGFALLFGGSLADALCSGVCGLLVGIINRLIDSWGGNQFFRIIAAAFPMALLAYSMDALHLSDNTDCVIIGALMLLVPGLLFTNAMRDIIFGDTNSGINRIVQVLLIAVAIALGTAAAWRCSAFLWGTPAESVVLQHNLLVHCFAAFVGCIGFTILFNIHGWGSLLCVLAGVLAWLTYLLTLRMGSSDLTAYFFATLVAAAYSEAMARIRKFPAISYLVVGIFPLIPGAGVYYTMNHAVQGRMDQFASQGMHTAAIAGIMAVGILLVSTTVRIVTTLRRRRKA